MWIAKVFLLGTIFTVGVTARLYVPEARNGGYQGNGALAPPTIELNNLDEGKLAMMKKNGAGGNIENQIVSALMNNLDSKLSKSGFKRHYNFHLHILGGVDVEGEGSDCGCNPCCSSCATPCPSVGTPATTPSTEVTTPSTEVTTPSTEVTTPSTEVTTPSTEVTTPSTEVTTPSTEVTTPSTEVTTPSTEVTTPTTEPTTMKPQAKECPPKFFLSDGRCYTIRVAEVNEAASEKICLDYGETLNFPREDVHLGVIQSEIQNRDILAFALNDTELLAVTAQLNAPGGGRDVDTNDVHLWIGINRDPVDVTPDDKKYDWKYTFDKTPVGDNYLNFHDPEPNNSKKNEECVYMYLLGGYGKPGNWNDHLCTMKNAGVLCEYLNPAQFTTAATEPARFF